MTKSTRRKNLEKRVMSYRKGKKNVKLDEKTESVNKSIDESMEAETEKKGVKMFKGLREEEDTENNHVNNSSFEDDDIDNDDDDDDDDNDDENENIDSEDEPAVPMIQDSSENDSDDDNENNSVQDNIDSSDDAKDSNIALKPDSNLVELLGESLAEEDDDNDDDFDVNDVDESMSEDEVSKSAVAEELKAIKSIDKDDDEDNKYEDEDEPGLKALLGASLADEDDDDDDFNANDEDESMSEDEVSKSAVAEELKANKSIGKNDEDDDISDDEDEDDNEDRPGLKALLGASLADEDDDDDDFDVNGEDESKSEDEVSRSAVEQELEDNVSCSENDNEDDEDDDNDEDEDGPGLKALLGESLVDDDDDEDFNEDDEDDKDDEDEDISDDSNDGIDLNVKDTESKKKDYKPIKLSPEEQAAKDSRTIYVGNVPKEVTVKDIKKLFRPFGIIENIRVRGVVAENDKTTAKIASITKKLHPKVKTVYIYVCFKDQASATKALKLNGHKLLDNTLRVDLCNSKNDHDQKKAVFLGNLPFELTDEDVHSHFASCGKIESVRIVKDRKTGLSRGVGYINFMEEDSVALALELNNTKMKNRQIRVKKYSTDTGKKKRKHHNSNQVNVLKKKFKNNHGNASKIMIEKKVKNVGKHEPTKKSGGKFKNGKNST